MRGPRALVWLKILHAEVLGGQQGPAPVPAKKTQIRLACQRGSLHLKTLQVFLSTRSWSFAPPDLTPSSSSSHSAMGIPRGLDTATARPENHQPPPPCPSSCFLPALLHPNPSSLSPHIPEISRCEGGRAFVFKAPGIKEHEGASIDSGINCP